MITLVDVFKDRMLKQNKNVIVIVIGETGSGKSYAALRLAELTDPTFSINRVVFSASELINRVKKDDLVAGNCLVWDEAGVNLAARSFMTRSNKAMNFFLQTFRKMNLCLFFTLPSLDMLDSQARKLAHFVLEPVHIYRKEGICKIKPFINQVNAKSGKVYNKYLRVPHNYKGYKLTRANIRLPTVKLRHQYEKHKQKFLYELVKDVQTTLDEPMKIEAKQHIDLDKIIDELVKNPGDTLFSNASKSYIDPNVVRERYNVPYSKGRYIKRMVEKRLNIGLYRNIPHIIPSKLAPKEEKRAELL